ncbi:MAG TPA: T9SS type A sorting domain-containing protein [bacterium]|jgi:hypothetical protein
MRVRKRSFLWVAAILLLVCLASAFASGVSEADIARIKAKAVSGQTFTNADIALAKQINATTDSRIDLEQALNPSSRLMHNPLDNQGGPDGFGYAFNDNVAPDTATYNWIELCGDPNATDGPTGDDATAPATIGFTFSFYGTNYTTCNVTTNGLITFGGTNTAFSASDPATTTATYPYIAPFWADMNTGDAQGTGGGCNSDGTAPWIRWKTVGTGADQHFVVEWRRMPEYNGTANLFSFEAILYPSGKIKVQYHATDWVMPTLAGRNWACGLDGLGATDGARYWFHNNVDNSDLGFVPAAGRVIWFALPTGVPNPVTNLQGSVAGSDVTLTWVDPNHDTNGNPLTPDSILIFRNGVLPAQQIGHVGPGVQTFTATAQPDGHITYFVRAKAGTYMSAPASVAVAVGETPWRETGYDWVDITTVGTIAAQADDINTGPYDLGFTFNYYDTPFTQIRVCSNGYITFGDATVTLSPPCPPNAGVPNGVVYGFARDLFPTAGQCKYYADAANQRFIVSWDNCPAFGGSPFYNFQIILTSSGSITMNYGAMGNTSGVVGLENLDGSDGFGLWCSTTGEFTPGGNNAVQFWGGPLVYATVTGHVTLDGGNGDVTAVAVRANGAGTPSVHPAANGDYTLSNVQIGNNRRVTATLAGYIDGSTVFNLDESGHTGANLTLRRTNPPAPTNLTSSVLTVARKDSLHWDVSTDLLVDAYKVYRRLQGETTWNLRQTVTGRTTQWVRDTLETDGVYQFVITAIDNGVTNPPVESDYSNMVTNPFGHLPPIMLSANGNFDNKIQLAWRAPGSPPESELLYDDGTDEGGGIGFNQGFPAAWFVSHFQTTSGPATISRIDAFFTGIAVDGNAIQLAVFADAGNGTPSTTPLGLTDATQTAPFDVFTSYTLASPVTVPSGSFFVGVRQMTATRVEIGGDNTTPYINNTFYYTTDGTAWNTWESIPLLYIPMIRCYASGAFGGLAELSPSPAVTTPTTSAFSAVLESKTVKALKGTASVALAANKSGKVDVRAAMPTSARPMSPWAIAQHRLASVAPHSPIVYASGSAGRHGHSLDDVIRYVIFRDGTARDSVAGTILTYDDIVGSANENHPYSYAVAARWDDGVLSAQSNVVTNARCNMAPATPGNVGLAVLGETQMSITWADPTTNADGTPCVDLAGIRVYRDGTLITATPVAPGVHSYTDTPPDPRQMYTWSVKAIDEVPNESAGADTAGFVNSPYRTVEYNWIDISTVGTNTGIAGDDISAGPFDLGFNFPYFGQTYNTINVCSNGFASFNSTSTTFTNQHVPQAGNPTLGLYPFWDDLNLSSAGQCLYYSDASNQRFVIAWLGVPMYSGGALVTFELVLDPSGGVMYQWQTTAGDASVTVGLENGDNTAGFELCYNGTGPICPTDGGAVQFWGGPRQAIQGVVRHAGTPPTALAGAWVRAGNDSTQTDGQGAYNLPVAPGTYTVSFRHATHCDTARANIVVEQNVNTTLNMSMRSAVGSVSATSLTFVAHQNETVPQTFTITNAGTGACPMTFQVLDSVTWLSSNPATGTVDPGQTVTITVTAAPGTIAPGDRHTTMRVVASAPGSPFLINVDMTVLNVEAIPGLLPTVFALHANYPNPFNPTTLLPFDVPQNSQVNIVVYNVMGQEVVTLVNGKYAAGRYQATFNAENLPSGLYLVKMTAGNYTAMNKMMLLK